MTDMEPELTAEEVSCVFVVRFAGHKHRQNSETKQVMNKGKQHSSGRSANQSITKPPRKRARSLLARREALVDCNL